MAAVHFPGGRLKFILFQPELRLSVLQRSEFLVKRYFQRYADEDYFQMLKEKIIIFVINFGSWGQIKNQMQYSEPETKKISVSVIGSIFRIT